MMGNQDREMMDETEPKPEPDLELELEPRALIPLVGGCLWSVCLCLCLLL